MPRIFIFHRPLLIVNAVCHILSIGIFLEFIKLIHYSHHETTNVTIRLKGDTVERTVSLDDNANFMVGLSGWTLILDSNITLKGRPENYRPLVQVEGGNALVMNEGARISSSSSSGVYVSDGGTFTMSGGAISVNSSFSNGGGVYVFGTFNMSGGAISVNSSFSNGGGVYVGSGLYPKRCKIIWATRCMYMAIRVILQSAGKLPRGRGLILIRGLTARLGVILRNNSARMCR
jgi:hypothetical protein